MAKILGLPFDDYVDKQVNIRQIKLAKTQKDPEDLVVFNSSTAWVRLSSGVKIESDKAATLSLKLGISQGEVEGINLASKLVLFGGSAGYSNISGSVTFDGARGGVGYGLNKAYGFLTTSDQGLKPPPGITNINSSYKNNGSLRQAQVSIKCYSRSQFEALEAVYLRLGYSLVLEWGNSVYFDNSGNIQQTQAHTIPNILYKDNNDVDPDTVREAIQKNKKTTACNYDAMMAKVSNYSWTLNEDLSFDIKLDLISVGDIIDSLKANLAGSAGEVTLQVQTSGSIQNIVNIIINKEVSKVNKLFYEMYDEVFKDLLLKFGSAETKAVVQQADNVEKTVGLVEEIKTKYNDALFNKLYEPFNLYKEARDLIITGKLTKESIDANVRLQEITVALGWNEYTPGTLYNAVSISKIKSPDDYKSKIDTLKAYFTNIKPSTTKEGTSQLEYLKKDNNPLGVLIRALDTGYFDSGKKFPIADVIFKDSDAFTESLAKKFFKGVYGSNLSPDFGA
jgi:hypothetical protein